MATDSQRDADETRMFLRHYISYASYHAVRGIQLFQEKLSENVDATIPKGYVGGFELTVHQRNLKEWHDREAVEVCLRVLK